MPLRYKARCAGFSKCDRGGYDRIEKAFGVKMDTLMRMQSSYDIAQTRKRENQIRVPRISVLASTH
jgi:plasmid maintenance system antidote protein VapI